MKDQTLLENIEERDFTRKKYRDFEVDLPPKDEKALVKRAAADLREIFARIRKSDHPDTLPFDGFQIEWDSFARGGVAWVSGLADGACYHEPGELRVPEISAVELPEHLENWRRLELAVVVGKGLEVACAGKAFSTLPLAAKVEFSIGLHGTWDQEVFTFVTKR